MRRLVTRQEVDRLLGLVKAGVAVRDVAAELGVSVSCVYGWVKKVGDHSRKYPRRPTMLRFLVANYGTHTDADIGERFNYNPEVVAFWRRHLCSPAVLRQPQRQAAFLLRQYPVKTVATILGMSLPGLRAFMAAHGLVARATNRPRHRRVV